MPDPSYIQVNEGGDRNVAFVQRSKASSTVEETEVAITLPYIPTYRLTTPSPVPLSTPSSHLLQLLGSTLNRDLLRSIEITQVGNAASAKQIELEVRRIDTAGTGGTAVTANPADTVDPATTAAGMTLPTSKGTEDELLSKKAGPVLTAPAAGHERVVRFIFPETGGPTTKPPTIAAGGSSGIVVKNLQSDATATVLISAEFEEVFWA